MRVGLLTSRMSRQPSTYSRWLLNIIDKFMAVIWNLWIISESSWIKNMWWGLITILLLDEQLIMYDLRYMGLSGRPPAPNLTSIPQYSRKKKGKQKKKTKWNWLTLWWLACHLHSIFLYKWKRGMVWCLVLNSWVEKGKGSKNGVHVLDIFMSFVKLKIMYARYLIAFCGMVFMSVFFFSYRMPT